MAASPSLHAHVWSTNRGSQGKHFDLWTASGTFRDCASVFDERDGRPRPLAELASPGNELGLLYVAGEQAGLERWTGEAQIVFASDRAGGTGGLDLYR